jgi:hypothetical protein
MRQTSPHGGIKHATVKQLAREHVRNVVPHAPAKVKVVRQPHVRAVKPPKKRKGRKGPPVGIPQPLIEGG